MSHTTTIKSVPIKDIEALRSAVAELKQRGVNCELVENAMPRMYYTDGRQDIKCEHVLKLNDSPYDVGFKRSKDGESLEMVCDLWAGHIKEQIGATCPVEGATENETALGQLTQAYAKFATINAATSAGYQVMDSYYDEQGNAQVQLAVL